MIIVDEALRLYPPAWAISRRSTRAEVVGGVEVPAGTLAIVSPWLMHRRAESWPDPHAFRPERWLDAGFPGTDRKYSGWANMLVFSDGPRNCIGMRLGELASPVSRD